MHERSEYLLPTTLPAARERAVELLCAHFAADHLTAEELERRLDLAHAAGVGGDLKTLLVDLPALPSGAAGSGVSSITRVGTVPAHRRAVSVIGDVSRSGAWVVPGRMEVLGGIMDVTLDLREARFGPGTAEITVWGLIGDVTVVVPPGMAVDTSVSTLIGDMRDGGDEPAPGVEAPVRIQVNLLIGDVKVETRLPGETAKEAKRRRRGERR
jgi:hypothetical protein